MPQEYIGVDLHKAFFRACAMDPTGERAWEGRFPRTADGVSRFIARGIGASQAVAVEASGPTWAFVDALRPTGARVCVVDPRKTKLKAGFAAKTDRLDAVMLARLYRSGHLTAVHVPDEDHEALRRLLRLRETYHAYRTATMHRISGILRNHGHVFKAGKSTWTKKHRRWLGLIRGSHRCC